MEPRPLRDGDGITHNRILELASQDIGLIRKVIIDKSTPIEALRTAEHLNEAYREYMQSLRVVGDARPWENAPESKVCGCDCSSL